MIRSLPISKMTLLLIVVLVGLILHGALITFPHNGVSLRFAESHNLALDKPLDQPPAFNIDRENRVHLLTYTNNEGWLYQIMTPVGDVLVKRTVAAIEGQVVYYTPVKTGEGEFLVVVNRDGSNVPFILSIQEEKEEWLALPFHLAKPKDVDAIRIGDILYCFYANRLQTKEFTLQIQQFNGAEWTDSQTIVPTARELGLPRIGLANTGNLHLTWKGKNQNLDAQFYNRLELSTNSLTFLEHIMLGDASFTFGQSAGMNRPYDEDTGAALLPTPDGGMYLSWTYSFWVMDFDKKHSSIMISQISPEGQVLETRTIKGSQDFALFADLAYDRNGNLSVFYEDYRNRRFLLMQASVISGQIQEEIIIKTHGSHRLVNAANDGEGNIVVTWKHISGDTDNVMLRNSSEMAPPRWYDRWSMWFLHDGPVDTVRESFFALIYTLIGTVMSIGRNALVLAIFAVLLYFLQARRILDRLNFFFVMAVASTALVLSKLSGHWLYSTPVAEPGFMLFSDILATVLTFAASTRYWNKSGEETLYLSHILLWIFADALISFIYVAPGVFAP